MSDSTEEQGAVQELIEHKSEAEKERVVQELVLQAANILKSMGPERARVGWMLEDTLMYLDDIGSQDAIGAFETTSGQTLEIDSLDDSRG